MVVEVKADRHGSGLRYRARYVGPDGTEKSKSFRNKVRSPGPGGSACRPLSLVGVGVGLPVVLAGCTKARWPEVLGGPLVCPEPVGGTRKPQALLARMIAVGCVLLAGVKVFWAANDTLGLNADELDRRDLWWHMLSASTVLWALAGAWGILALTAQRGTRPVSPADGDGLGVIGDAVLVPIYNLLTLTDMQRPSPELPIAGGLAPDASAVLGVMMGVTLLLVLHNRRRALRAQV